MRKLEIRMKVEFPNLNIRALNIHSNFECRHSSFNRSPHGFVLSIRNPRSPRRGERGLPIVGGGAGTGLIAKLSEAGGIDLLVIYNSGRFRMAGRGSLAGLLPYGDANAIVMDMVREVLPVVRHTPVLAGVCGTDPFRVMKLFLREVDRAGFSGVQNFPTVGLFDGTLRTQLEETGMGYGLEVDMIREAHAQGLLTTPYAFNPDEAAAMAEAGADILIPHIGLTTKGMIGAETAATLDDAAAGAGHARRRQTRAARYSRPLPRWPHRRTGRCPVHSRSHHGNCRLLWRQQHGAVAGRTGDYRPSTRIHGVADQR